MNMKKQFIIIAAIAILLSVFAYAYDILRTDPNFVMKHASVHLTLDQSEDITYIYDRRFIRTGRTYIPVFVFKPDESASYTFTLSDIGYDNIDADLVLNIMDEKMSDYMQVDTFNYDEDASGEDSPEASEILSAPVFLTAKKPYFITVDVLPDSADISHFRGKFRITVTKTPEEPETLLTEGEPQTVTVGISDQAVLHLRPAENGYYAFDCSIVSQNGSDGYSNIDSVTSSDSKEMKLYGDFCYLKANNDYYVRVSVDDIKSRSADVEVSCSRIRFVKLDTLSDLEISGRVLAACTAEETCRIVIYSESDGNPHGTIYDENGYPVGSDDDSGAVLSGHEGDFALVLNAEKGKSYALYCGGEYSKCRIKFGLYTGDGTSLTDKNISPLGSDQDSEKNSEEPGGKNDEGSGTEGANQ